MRSCLCFALAVTILSSFGLAHPGHDLSNTDRTRIHPAAATIADRQHAEEVRIDLGVNSFSVDAPSTIASHSQDANGLTFSNSQQGDTLAGLLVSGPVKLPFASSFGLIMSSQAGSPLPLGVRLLDTDFKTIFSMQVGVADLAGNGQRFVPLTPALTGDGNPAAMAAIVFDWNKGTQNPTTISSLVIRRPHVTSTAMTGGRFSLSWLSTAAAHVQRRTSLTEGEWETISTNNSDGFYLDNSTPPGRAYYRVIFPTPTPSPSPTPTPTPAPVPTPQPGEEPPTGMVNVQGGVFSQNLSGSSFAGATAPSFFMSMTEVTWDEWKTVRDFALTKGYDLPVRSSEGSGDYPVTGITWYEALKWCNAKSEKEGLITAYRVNGEIYRTGNSVPTLNVQANGYRLPSNLEWEWAARGGKGSGGFIYSGGNSLDAIAWHQGNSSGTAQRVATKVPNELGLYDMTGNAWEMVWDERSVLDAVFAGGGFSTSWGYEFGENGFVSRELAFGDGGFRTARSYGLVEMDKIPYPVKEDFLDIKVHEFLGATHPQAKKIVPVVIINYLSSADGTYIIEDQTIWDGVSEKNFPISELNKYFLLQSVKVKASLNEATKFRGFIDPLATPYVSYKVIKYINLYEIDKVEVPSNPQVGREGWAPDYKKVFARVDLRDAVDNKGAKDVWFFHRWLALPESSMASPKGLGVSNGISDLPVYSKSYVVYTAPAYSPWVNLLHCMGHQFERQLESIDGAFFWQEFVGAKVSFHPAWWDDILQRTQYYREGKCGSTHFTPNSEKNYDYGNSVPVDSNIIDWSPDPGRKTISVNKDFWTKPRPFVANLPSFSLLSGWDWASSDSYVGEDGQSGWMITWFQSLPSDVPITFTRSDVKTSRIDVQPDASGKFHLENWWEILYDWDEVYDITEGPLINLGNGVTVRESTMTFKKGLFR